MNRLSQTLPSFLLSCVLFASAPVLIAAENTATFYVAPNGQDTWSGRRATPNLWKSDGPFATLPKALSAARDALKPGTAVTVFLRGGTYFLEQPLVLEPAHSTLTLAAYRDEHPVISGGRRITGWKETVVDGKKLWMAHVPEARDGQWIFRELWIGGQRATRARHPNRGYLPIADLPDKTKEWTDGQTRFQYRENDLQPLKNATDAEVVAMTRWVESRLPLVGIDEKDRIASFAKRSVFQLSAGDLYYLEGALDLLDTPGEWYLDSKSGTLYYLPKPGESPARVEAIAPALAQLLRFEGKPESGQFIDRVTVRGLTFSHSEWYFPGGFHKAKDAPVVSPEPKAEVGGFAQAAIGVPGAVWGQGLRNCVFERCSFTQLGSYGLELTRGCQNNRLTRCEFADLGAGGLKLGETAVRDQPSEQTRHNEISDCRIHDGGKMFHSAIGIWIGQSPDNSIVHNLIHDFYYTGISIGWTWGYGKALATNNLVAFNHVHHIGAKSDGDGPILSDMGGIYTLSMQPGTRILNNLWHDIAGFRYGGWGIYFDEGSSSILAESNLVYRTTHGGFHQHYGATNRVRNNIFAFARDHQVQRSRVEPHPSFSFVTNIVFFDQGVLLGGTWEKDQFEMDWNVYFDARPDAKEIRPANVSLEQWRARGHDRHSLIADPRFRAPKQDDFRLQPDSPAFKLGFHPIDLSKVGPRPGK